MVKKIDYSLDDDTILVSKGVNFELYGKVIILIRTDVIPEKYIPYAETHEKWEAYIGKKDGFNLWNKSKNEYKKNKNIKNFDYESWEKYSKNLNTYNYEFRHEYAIYKEYQQALKDGRLEEYHNWFINTKEKEKKDVKSEEAIKSIENDIEIRKSIYKKLTEDKNHSFLRK